jgi:hypothetical protein
METYIDNLNRKWDIMPDPDFGHFARLRRKNAKLYLATRTPNGAYRVRMGDLTITLSQNHPPTSRPHVAHVALH